MTNSTLSTTKSGLRKSDEATRIPTYNAISCRELVVILLVLCLQILSPIEGRADTEAYQCVRGPWMKGVKVDSGMNVSGKRLYGCIFVGVTMDNAVFDDCDFYGAEFYQCDLRNASFKRANMNGLRFGDCKLDGADFTDALINGIKPIYEDYYFTAEQFMSTYSYKSKNLSDCFLWIALENRKIVPYHFDFRDADLRGTIFAHCDLRKCDFTNADITGMTVRSDKIDVRQIMSTKSCQRTGDKGLSKVDLPILKADRENDFSNFWFTESSFRGLLYPYNNLSDAKLYRCELYGGIAKGALDQTHNYKRGDLSGNMFTGVDFRGMDLSRQNLTGCRFQDCDFSDVSFDDAVISSTSFSQFREHRLLLTLAQIKSTWNYKNGRMEGVVLPKDIADALPKENR